MIQQLASPSALYEEPENAFVAQFIGENNRLCGKVNAVEGNHCQVDLDGGGTVRALNVRVEGAGTRTTLSLRPERVIVACEDGEVDNSIMGRVEELIYLGDHIRARLSVGATDEFVVKIPNTERHAALRAGMDVNLGWAANDCRALDAPAEVDEPG